MPTEESENTPLKPPSRSPPSATRRAGPRRFQGHARGLMVVLILSVLVAVGFQSFEGYIGREIHSVIETAAAALALIVGILTLVRFYANGTVIHLCVGAGFVGTGLLDGSHAFLASSFFATIATSAPDSLIPWSWTASRIFLGAILAMSCWAQSREDQRPDEVIIRPVFVYVSILLLTVLCFLFFAFAPLPPAYRASGLRRPFELVPALLLGCAALMMLRRGKWRSSPYGYWLLASLFTGIVLQTIVMVNSKALFDVPFLLAHLMKLASYCLVLFGTMRSIHILYHTSEAMTVEIAQSEAKLRGIIDQAFNFIGLLSTDGTLLDGNRTALDSAGVAAQDVLGKPFWETPWWSHSEELQERLKEAVRRANSGQTDRFEATHPTADGSLIYIDFTLKPIRDDFGEIIFLVPEGRDITEMKAATNALITAELRLENALDGAEIGVWDWNVVTDDVFVSPQLTAQLGSNTPWTSLNDWIDHLHPDDQDSAEKQISDYLSGEIPEYENTFRLKHVDDSYRWILSRGQLLRDDDGEPLRMVGVHIDITERVQQQKQLADQAEELRLSNTELEQFAYVASHDLQEPLRAIAGYAQLLLDEFGETLGDKGSNYADRAVAGTKRMQQLISDLLEYSRVSRKGRSFKPTDLNECLQDAQALLAAPIHENEAVIETTDLPTVMADSSQMVRLLQNLIGNAIKYRSEATPRIAIAAHRDTDSSNWQIHIQDNGIGIDEEYSDRIFVIFQRLHTRQEYPGTGIGLAICRRIVERHGGSISMKRNDDTGCTFTVTLPDAASMPETPAVDEAASSQ